MTSDYQIMHVLPSMLSEQDLTSLATILTAAFHSKLAHVGLTDAEIYGLHKAYVLDEIRNPMNVFLAARRVGDGKILGVCELLLPLPVTAPSPKFKKDEHVRHFLKSVGFFRKLRAGKFRIGMPGDIDKRLGIGESYIKALGVDPEVRGKGLGNMLLAEADSVSVKHGFSKISLHVAGNNTRAKQLYERVGYLEDKCKSVRGSLQRAVSRICVGEDGFFYLSKALDP